VETARVEARKLRTAGMRVTALTAIADLTTDDTQARETAEEAAKIVTGELGDQVISPWVLARLVRIGAGLNLPAETLLALAGRIREAEQLRGWAQYQVFRMRLAGASAKADEAILNEIDPASLAHRLARMELVRHNTARDSSAAKVVDGWDDALKPFGYVGVAMGLQGGK
jgi:hypothetical protein